MYHQSVFLTFELSVCSTIVCYFFNGCFMLSVTGHLLSLHTSIQFIHRILRCRDLFRKFKRLVHILRTCFFVNKTQFYFLELYDLNLILFY